MSSELRCGNCGLQVLHKLGDDRYGYHNDAPCTHPKCQNVWLPPEQPQTAEDDELIKPEEAFGMARFSKSDGWRRVEEGTFPKPVRLSERIFRFSKVEVQAWIRRQLAARR